MPQPNHEIDSAHILNSNFTSWTYTNQLVKAQITSTLSKEAFGLIISLVMSSNRCSALDSALAKDLQVQEYELIQKLWLIKKGSTSKAKYHGQFKPIYEFNSMGKPIDDQTKLFSSAIVLDTKYESFARTFLKPLSPLKVGRLALQKADQTSCQTLTRKLRK